jgi:glycine/D-amino acid oxidase-like deaminating enzyme
MGGGRPVVRHFAARALTPRDAERGLWMDEALRNEPAPRSSSLLAADTSADVCIVGGGFVGMWVALELKRRQPSWDVVLVEADICGGGASGRNGGFVMSWWSKFATLQKLCGTASALDLARRAERAARDVGRLCEEHGIDARFRPCGWLWTATNPAQVDAWKSTVTALEAAGEAPFEVLTRQEVAERSGSPVHLAGIFEPGVATVEPARLARGLLHVIQTAGVRVYEQTPMTALLGGEPACVRTPHGAIRTPIVILALGAWAARLAAIGRSLVVVSSDVIATEPIPDLLDAIGWRDGPAVSDSRRLVNYYRTSAEGRVMFGKGGGTLAVTGRLGPAFHRPSPRLAEVAAQFRFIHPMLWQARVERAWRGPIDYSITGLPFFCWLSEQPNVLVATGFSGNGVGPARMAGELLADMALNRGDADLPAALTRPPRKLLPPEPLRYVAGRAVRAAISRKESCEDLGRRVDPLSRFLAELDPTGFVDRGKAKIDHGRDPSNATSKRQTRRPASHDRDEHVTVP